MKADQLPSFLVYVTNEMPGYHRLKKGHRFIYKNEHGRILKGKRTLKRIEKLTIPPMWKDVWISSEPKGHIQATGRDEKGRKQYIYHSRWREYISEQKYDKLIDFAELLPTIRQRIDRDLRQNEWPKEKVAALAVKLMDKLYLRIGNKYYEEENGTYGITTLRKKHLKDDEAALKIQFKGKSGKLKKATTNHPTLKKLLKECSELPGYELFRYKSNGQYRVLNSEDVNEYLREISAHEISAKNFRTWGGTVLAIKFEPRARKIVEENPRKKKDVTLVRLVSKELNNTVAVSRKYYIHPKVLEAMSRGNIDDFKLPEAIKGKKWYSKYELLALSILKPELQQD